MNLTLFPYALQFKHPFRIAHGVRTHTDVVFVKLQHEGLTAWGEATLPPYLPETQQSVISFLSAFARSMTTDLPEAWLTHLSAESENMAAKAALDMALWSMKAQIQQSTISELLGIKPEGFPPATYTIGVSSPEEMKKKIAHAFASGFDLFKLKLTGEKDEEVISHFRAITNNSFAVDINQGWKSVEEAVEKTHWLKEAGCVLIEQPLKKDALNDMHLLKLKSALPLYADESCQRLSDIEKLKDCFDGINIKLMKCGGISEAFQMIVKARALNMKVLIGCMSESSVGCTAAAQLTPLADYADLDGPYLISNDPFEGMKVSEGRICIKPLVDKGLIL